MGHARVTCTLTSAYVSLYQTRVVVHAGAEVWSQLHDKVTHFMWSLLDVRCARCTVLGVSNVYCGSALTCVRRGHASFYVDADVDADAVQAKLNNKVVRFTDKRRARELQLFTTVHAHHIADVVSTMPGLGAVRGSASASARANVGGGGGTLRSSSPGRGHGRPSPHTGAGAGTGQSSALDANLIAAQDETAGACRVLNQYFGDLKAIFRFYSTGATEGANTVTRDGWWKFIKDCRLRGRTAAHASALESIFDCADKDYDFMAGNGELADMALDNPDSYVCVCVGGGEGIHTAVLHIDSCLTVVCIRCLWCGYATPRTHMMWMLRVGWG